MTRKILPLLFLICLSIQVRAVDEQEFSSSLALLYVKGDTILVNVSCNYSNSTVEGIPQPVIDLKIEASKKKLPYSWGIILAKDFNSKISRMTFENEELIFIENGFGFEQNDFAASHGHYIEYYKNNKLFWRCHFLDDFPLKFNRLLVHALLGDNSIGVTSPHFKVWKANKKH